VDDLSRNLRGAGKVLLVGDGDGRFLEVFLKAVDDVCVDYVDLSEGMMRLAKRRVSSERVRYFTEDFREWEGEKYDAVVAHFFLDGFVEEDLGEVVEKLCVSVRSGGVMVVSDFDPNIAWWGRLWVCVMRLFFRFFGGVRIGEVERYDSFFKKRGLEKISEFEILKGFVYSVMFQKV